MNRFPNGRHAQKAREELNKKKNANIENQDWNTAFKKNTIEGYNTYIKKYPKGKHLEEAKNKIEELSKPEKNNKSK